MAACICIHVNAKQLDEINAPHNLLLLLLLLFRFFRTQNTAALQSTQ